MWTRERFSEVAARVAAETEFERRRQQRMDERSAHARLYRVQSGTVLQFPSRPPVEPEPDWAA